MMPDSNLVLICKRDTQQDNWQRRIACWECRLRFEGRQIDVNVMIPYDVGSPSASDVLVHLLDEADSVKGTTFDTWLDSLGLEKNRETRKSYERAQHVGKSLTYLLDRRRSEIASLARTEIGQSPDNSTFQPTASVDDYSYDGMSLKELMDYCHRVSLKFEASRRRLSSDKLRELSRDVDWSSSTAHSSWAGLKGALQSNNLRKAAQFEHQAKRDHKIMLETIRRYDQELAD